MEKETIIRCLDSLSDHMGDRIDSINFANIPALETLVEFYNRYAHSSYREEMGQIIKKKVRNINYPPKTIGYFLINCLMNNTQSDDVTCGECSITPAFMKKPTNTVVNYYGNGKYNVKEGINRSTVTFFVDDIREKNIPLHMVNKFSKDGFEQINVIVRRGKKYLDGGYLSICEDKYIKIPKDKTVINKKSRDNNSFYVFIIFILVLLFLLLLALLIKMRNDKK